MNRLATQLGSLLLLGSLAFAPPAAAEPTTTPQQQGEIFGQTPRLNPIRFRHARQGDVFYPVNINNWWGHIAQDGDLIVFPAFEWTDDAYENLIRAVKNGKTGFLKTSGNWYIDPIHPYADRFAEGHAVVGDGEGKFGYINKAGRPLTPVAFDGALRFKDNVAAVLKDGRVGFIDKRGRYTIEPRFIKARSFHDGVAMVQLPGPDDQPGPVGFIDRRGKLVFLDKTGRVTDLGDFNENLAAAQVTLDDGSRRWGYIDKTYKLRIEPRFVAARDFTNGVAAVAAPDAQGEATWGYIDKRGKWVIEPTFDDADEFDDTLAMVRVADRFGFTDKTGRRGVAPQFAFAEPYFRDYARVQAEPNFGYIDISGRVVWDPRWPFDQGIVDQTPRTRGAVATSDHRVGDQLLPAPPAREPPNAAYPPEYLYEEVLPQPER